MCWGPSLQAPQCPLRPLDSVIVSTRRSHRRMVGSASFTAPGEGLGGRRPRASWTDEHRPSDQGQLEAVTIRRAQPGPQRPERSTRGRRTASSDSPGGSKFELFSFTAFHFLFKIFFHLPEHLRNPQILQTINSGLNIPMNQILTICTFEGHLTLGWSELNFIKTYNHSLLFYIHFLIYKVFSHKCSFNS